MPTYDEEAPEWLPNLIKAIPPLAIHPLRLEITDACGRGGLNQADLTVITSNDPYRLDTPVGRQNGQWFAAMVAQFVPATRTIHLRGLHYLLISAREPVLLPDGSRYLNTDEHYFWLGNSAAKCGRWLGYVAFERIHDERNDPARVFVYEDYTDDAVITGEADCGYDMLPEIPIIVPHVKAMTCRVKPAYRIILIGEKSSLYSELAPIARGVEGELILPTGEISDTLIYQMAQRIVADGREAVILYFSDFDPAGYQMPISVARKLQALKTLMPLDLAARFGVAVYPVALTLKQALAYDLPTSPLKEGEKRKEKWVERWGREQTEIDALIALNPGTLAHIARQAVKPFFDTTLTERSDRAMAVWRARAADELGAGEGYDAACVINRAAYNRLTKAIAAYQTRLTTARNLLPEITAEVAVPEPEIACDSQPQPLFSSDVSWLDATVKLVARHRYEDADADAEGFEDGDEDYDDADDGDEDDE
jgi:hypothetical protein